MSVSYTSPSQHPGMGAIVHDTGCSFRVWAPNAARISVIGDFNGWTRDAIWLYHEGDGFWSADVAGVKAGEEYKLRIENRGDSADNRGGVEERKDARSCDVVHSGFHGNSIVVDVPAELADSRLDLDPFQTPSRRDLILYQLHIGTFCGTYERLIDQLDYIRGLGFNAIALLPDVENAGDGGAGYGPADFFAPESSYGRPLALRRLVRAAHDRGLAVIFDAVYNHASDWDNTLWEYDGNRRQGGPYFEDTQKTPWGPRPAHHKREVRDFFLDNARMWLRDYRGDGIRFDAAHEIDWACLAHIIAGLRADPFWHGKYLVAEWDGRQAHRFWHVIHDLGFDALWGINDPHESRDAMNNLGGGSARARLASLERLLENHGCPRAWSFVRYPLGSHDDIADVQRGGQTGHRYFVELAGKRDNWHARAKARLGWALAAAIPGTPMLFMGTEVNHPGYWSPASDANGEHRFDWSLLRTWEGEQMMRLVGGANATRWQNPALRADALEVLHRDGDNGVLAFKRWNDEGNVVLVVVNIGDAEWRSSDYGVAMGGERGGWREIFNSQAAEYGGYDCGNGGRTLHVQGDGRLHVSLPRWSVVMFEKQ
jgi:1,4-alpha-glucan branching enzyme